MAKNSINNESNRPNGYKPTTTESILLARPKFSLYLEDAQAQRVVSKNTENITNFFIRCRIKQQMY